MTVVSSVNLSIIIDWKWEIQPFEYMSGDRTHPCGAPVFGKDLDKIVGS